MIPPTGAALLSATIAMISFQIGATFAKQLIPEIGAPGTTALRLGLSALLLVALQRPWRSMPSRAALPAVLAYGVSLGAMNSVFYLALSRIPLGIAVAIEFVGPLAVAVFASRRRLDYLWVGLAAIGLSLLLPITRSGAVLDPIGVLYALAAGVGWALYIVFGQKAGQAQGAKRGNLGPDGRSAPDRARRHSRRGREALRPVHPAVRRGRGHLLQRAPLHAGNDRAPDALDEGLWHADEL